MPIFHYPQTSPGHERALKNGKAMPGTQSLVCVTPSRNKLFSQVNKHCRLHPLPKPLFLVPKHLTSTKVPSATSNFSMQEHGLRRHLCVKSCLDVIHKRLAVRAVHPDALPKGVLNVHLQKGVQSIFMGLIKGVFVTSYGFPIYKVA